MEKFSPSIRPYLEEISRCLWSKNASIMVGAGFSMNAKATFDNAKRFPSWQDLGNVFYKKVRGEEIQHAEYNFFDPLKLAYEVEANFGRSVLDSMLRINIPDSDYKPSLLHNALLSLPWTDVFTTNYDTLLERAADTVSERNYNIVVNKDNLVHSVSPRIVKLHGCFSASTPLIISEEDYRTYPQKYAPFVNTVQQTLLENTLCLIGFSGDDPNFLKWIGWIRDNLGVDNAPKIYLIGVLNLSTSQEKALTQYNITCVDMSLCAGIGIKDHQKGITEFLDYCLSKKESENRNEWDLSGQFSHSKVQNSIKASMADIQIELVELIKVWERERKDYPNWIIAPNERRQLLWHYTRNWSSVFDKELQFDQPILTSFVYEFLWRKNKSLLPIFDDEVELIKSSIMFDGKSIVDIGKERDKTFFIILALLRYYREEGKKEDWNQLFKLADEKFNSQFDHDFLIYERAINLLFENNRVELIHLLTNWNTNALTAFWMYRKASIFAEIDGLIDAKETLEKALIKTRKKINSSSVMSDYANVSLESYILVLLTTVNRAISLKAGNWSSEVNPFKERLNELRQYQCNPWQEKQLLELEISHEPIQVKERVVKNGFDIGSKTTVYNLAGVDDESLNAFRFLRFCEDAGLPISLPHFNVAATGAINAIRRIAIYAPYWSMCTMLRTRDQKSIELIFTRESLSNFNIEFIDALALRYIELLHGYVNKEKCLYEYGNVLPEALSRLCSRCKIKTKDKLLGLISTIYQNAPNKLRYQGVDKLVKRLINSYSDTQLYQRLGKITDISCSSATNTMENIDDVQFPNPFKFFLNLKTPEQQGNYLKLSSDVIRELLKSAESENWLVRKNSTLILIRLYKLDLLNKNQVKSLLAKLMLVKDQYGLPKHTLFRRFAFVDLFEKRKNIVSGLRKYLLEETPSIQVNLEQPNSYSITGQPDIYTLELSGCGHDISWSNEELHLHAKKLLRWWEADKSLFIKEKKQSNTFEEMNNRFSLLVDCVDLIIIRNNLSEYKKDIKRLIEEFQTYGLKYLHLKAVSISYLNIEQQDFVLEIEEALSSFDEQPTLDALLAINCLIKNETNLEPDLLNVFSNFIRYARNQYLISAFNIVISIITRQPKNFNLSIKKTVLDVLSKIAIGYKDLSFDENLELRESAANLASELSIYYKTENIDIPAALTQWKEICDSDNEFSEVKNQWKNER